MNHQKMQALRDGKVIALRLPPRNEELLQGIAWGRYDKALTPAFWAGQAWLLGTDLGPLNYRLGNSLAEETAACLLGGFGIPAETGIAAFHRLQKAGILDGTPSESEIKSYLVRPIRINGRSTHYRFPNQKARYLAGCLRALQSSPFTPENDLELRDFLLGLPGIGQKTASWITRNWLNSDNVAILDIHVVRACIAAGVFPTDARPENSYLELETRYLAFSKALNVKPSILDNIIWQVMRQLPAAIVQKTINSRGQILELV